MWHKRYNRFFTCPRYRVENESRQKKAAAAEGKTVNQEDPYGGSTDENTDAEAEEDHPIPELPGTSLFVHVSVSSCLSGALLLSHLFQRAPIITPPTYCGVISCTPLLLSLPIFSFLPDFLKGKHFFLYGKFPNNERRLLLRYIVAFNG